MKLPLWEPSAEQKQNANITKFIGLINERYATKINSFNELHDWSIKNLNEFWALAWEFGDIRASNPYDTVLTPAKQLMDAKWFRGARLNFAEKLPSSLRARVGKRQAGLPMLSSTAR